VTTGGLGEAQTQGSSSKAETNPSDSTKLNAREVSAIATKTLDNAQSATAGVSGMNWLDPGRVAGLWYLFLVLIGPLRLIYIPKTLFVDGNAAGTVNNIAAHEWLFRIGIVADLVCAVLLIFLGLALYRLFKEVDQNLAVLVVIFGGVMPAFAILRGHPQ
jgi:Domain of unknown function (DUF4386)